MKRLQTLLFTLLLYKVYKGEREGRKRYNKTTHQYRGSPIHLLNEASPETTFHTIVLTIIVQQPLCCDIFSKPSPRLYYYYNFKPPLPLVFFRISLGWFLRSQIFLSSKNVKKIYILTHIYILLTYFFCNKVFGGVQR